MAGKLTKFIEAKLDIQPLILSSIFKEILFKDKVTLFYFTLNYRKMQILDFENIFVFFKYVFSLNISRLNVTFFLVRKN